MSHSHDAGFFPELPTFISHDTAEDIVKAMVGSDGEDTDPNDWTDADGEFNLVDSVKRMGFWGFAHAGSNTIHYYVGPDVEFEKVLFFFGHELGHIANDYMPKLESEPEEIREELKADLFGWVSSEAYKIAIKALTV